MSKFLNLVSKYSPKEEPLLQSDLETLGSIAQSIIQFEAWQLPDEDQDRIAQVYSRLTGRSYSKFCKSCTITATHHIRHCLDAFNANLAHQKLIPPSDERPS